MSSIVHVMVGVLRNELGEILLSKRSEDKHQGSLWEFPGGKLELGETPQEGLIRELQEEIGVVGTSFRQLIQITHHYADVSVLLDVYLVEAWQGDVESMEGQPIKWVASQELAHYEMPKANDAILKALELPDTYLITPPAYEDSEVFLKELEDTLKSGVRLLQYRVFGKDFCEQNTVLAVAYRLCQRYGAKLLLNGSLEGHEVDGLHLSSRQLYEYESRPIPSDQLLGASCHSLEDLSQAVKLQADFALLSPVLPTKSHPDAEPLGWDKFSEMAEVAQLPVYALGGMKPAFMQQAWQRGAQGISGIRGIWCSESI